MRRLNAWVLAFGLAMIGAGSVRSQDSEPGRDPQLEDSADRALLTGYGASVDDYGVGPNLLQSLPPLKQRTLEVTDVTTGTTVLELNLEAAILMAMEQNPGLMASAENVEAARWRYYQERARNTPSLSGSRSYIKQTQPPSLGTFRVASDEVNQKRVNLTAPIYTFGRFRHAIRQRRHETSAARHTLDDERDRLILQVKQAFYGILLQSSLIETATRSLEELELQYSQSVARFEAGAATQFDVLLARSQLANARPQLIRALHSREIASQTLRSLLGVDAMVKIVPSGQFDIAPMATQFDEALKAAFERRDDLRALHARRHASIYATRLARASDHPTLDANVAHDKSQGQRFPVDQEVEINSVTFSLNVPFYDGGLSRAQGKELEAVYRQIEDQIHQLELTIRSEVVESYLRVEEAWELIEAAEEGLRSASRALQDAQLGYEAGVRTNLEVLDAQTALTTARTNLAQARHDYSVAKARLERVSGISTDKATASAPEHESGAAANPESPSGD